MSKVCRLLYGKTTIELTCPKQWSILEPNDPPPIEDLNSEIGETLTRPIR